MHSAPSVTYPVGRSRSFAGLLVVLFLAGVAGGVMGWQQDVLNGIQVALTCAVGLLSGVMACRFWMVMSEGELRWDGHDWLGPGASNTSARMRVHLDWQQHLLVHLRGADRPGQWLWLSASSRPARWNDLRRAVYSRAISDARVGTANP